MVAVSPGVSSPGITATNAYRLDKLSTLLLVHVPTEEHQLGVRPRERTANLYARLSMGIDVNDMCTANCLSADTFVVATLVRTKSVWEIMY